MTEVCVCGKEAKNLAGLKAHQRSCESVQNILGADGDFVEVTTLEEVGDLKIPGEFEVGDIVRHNIKKDRFEIADINERGEIGRKVNSRDPFVYYSPRVLTHESLFEA